MKALGVFQVTRMVEMVRFARQKSEGVDVSKALMAVSEMVDAGHQVTFNKVGGIHVSRAAHEEPATQ